VKVDGFFLIPVFQANIFQDRTEILIMKFPFLYAICLLCIITFFAGCSSSPSAPVTGTPSSAVMPWEVGTPVPYTDLSQLVLLRTEMPFIVMDEKNQTPKMTDPALSRFGAIRGYTRYSLSEKTESATSVQLGQMIVEYPPGNATRAFAEFEKENLNSGSSRYNITMSRDLGIGDRSCGLTITDPTGAEKPMAMIVFVKSNIMESVVMIGPSLDLNVLTRAGRMAAAKIPQS
jgi:hypothetical protein